MTQHAPHSCWQATDKPPPGAPALLQAVCNAARDYTCKLDAGGLQPGVPYAFRFVAPGGVMSPDGKFTLPYPKGE